MKVASILRSKAKLLRSYNPKKHSLDEVCRQSLIKQSYLASRLGITKQALEQRKDNIPEYREKQLVNEVRSLGDKLETIASKLEKIRT